MENQTEVPKIYDSKELIIEFHDNPKTGACSITEWAGEKWKTGIDKIDAIDFFLINNSDKDGFKVIHEPTGDVIFNVEGQKALLLNTLSEALISLLGIKIRR